MKKSKSRVNLNSIYPTMPMSTKGSDDVRETVVVIGSGDLGRALVSCFVRGGFRVVVASRSPEKARSRVEAIGAEVYDWMEALGESDIILLAIPFEAYLDLESSLFYDKILVDVSNRPPGYDKNGASMAERLQKMVPTASVVKAYNTLSAYALQRGLQLGSKQVPICSNDFQAKERIIEITKKLNFIPIDYGELRNAKTIEDIPLGLFPQWKIALIVSSVILIFFWTYILFQRQLCPNFEISVNGTWNWTIFEPFLLKNTGNSIALTALNVLASCYTPGVIAAYIQLARGTKYSIFPRWLDRWMNARKQLGLTALMLALLHMVIVITILIVNGSEGNYFAQSCLLAGFFSMGLMSILGITSLPSVSSSLTWKEFSFVQGYLGWLCLVSGIIHAIFGEYEDILEMRLACDILPDHIFIGLILPMITLVFKIPLLIPCTNRYLTKIRRGHERKSEKPKAKTEVLPFYMR